MTEIPASKQTPTWALLAIVTAIENLTTEVVRMQMSLDAIDTTLDQGLSVSVSF